MKKIVIACLMLGACSAMETKIGTENTQKVQCVSAMTLTVGATCTGDKACVKTKLKNNYRAIANKCGLTSLQELNAMYDNVMLMKSLTSAE